MIDILDRAKLFEILNKLKAEEKPAFGGMTPQHMVDHLAFTVCFSNGKEPQQHHYVTDKELLLKHPQLDKSLSANANYFVPGMTPETLSRVRARVK